MGFASTLEDIDERLRINMHLLGRGDLAPASRAFPAPEAPSEEKRLLRWLLGSPRELRAVTATAATAASELHELAERLRIEHDYAKRTHAEVLAIRTRGRRPPGTVWSSNGPPGADAKASSKEAMLLADHVAKELTRRSTELKALLSELQRGPGLCARCSSHVQSHIERARAILQDVISGEHADTKIECAREIEEFGAAMRDLITRIAGGLPELLKECEVILESLDLSRQELKLMAAEFEDSRRPAASRRRR